MRTSPRSRVRLASYLAGLGWLLLFLAVHRPESGSSSTFSHAGLALGVTGTILTAVATLAALAVSGDDGLYASAWLGGVAAAVLFVWCAFTLGSFNFNGLLSLGPAPDPRRDAVGHVVSIAGWTGLATGLTAFATTIASAARRDSENAKSRRTGGSSHSS